MEIKLNSPMQQKRAENFLAKPCRSLTHNEDGTGYVRKPGYTRRDRIIEAESKGRELREELEGYYGGRNRNRLVTRDVLKCPKTDEVIVIGKFEKIFFRQIKESKNNLSKI